jgi:hypothetical protein
MHNMVLLFWLDLAGGIKEKLRNREVEKLRGTGVDGQRDR